MTLIDQAMAAVSSGEVTWTPDLPLEAGKARLALARAIATTAPDASEAEARLALANFERLGATRYADAAEGLLRELGATGRAWPKNYGALTKRETESCRFWRSFVAPTARSM
jgi:hypothetical protein